MVERLSSYYRAVHRRVMAGLQDLCDCASLSVTRQYMRITVSPIRRAVCAPRYECAMLPNSLLPSRPTSRLSDCRSFLLSVTRGVAAAIAVSAAIAIAIFQMGPEFVAGAGHGGLSGHYRGPAHRSPPQCSYAFAGTPNGGSSDVSGCCVD